MRILLTLHVHEKLQEKDAKLLKITKKKILAVLSHPDKINRTNYPAEKGRYESKVF
ncbi:MAG: hypothetical protein Q7S44_04170 [bacterium]|nr:hypothetical protein [bacterium]